MTKEPAEARSPVPEGTLIAGKYRVGAILGVGGMGVVVAARHEKLEQDVAVKFLRKEASTTPDAVARFGREARAAAKLSSDHVVRVFDTGATEDGVPYLVMERLEGFDLNELTERGGAVAVDEAVGYVLEALEAIGEAHAAGIVHRDLKPSNLFLSKRPGGGVRVKVLDFGISKLMDPMSAVNLNLTSTQTMMGSPAYMSPEQVRSSRNVDTRTDVWSMGVILWELLSGEQAFQGESLGDVFAKIREEDLPPIRSLQPGVPAELEAVVMRCVSRDRELRFLDGEALAEALRPFASVITSPRASRPRGMPMPSIAQADTMPAADESAPNRPRAASSTQATFTSPPVRMKRRATAFTGAVAGGAAILAVVWAISRFGSDTGSPSVAGPAAFSAPSPRETTPFPEGVSGPIVVPGGAVVVTPSASASASPPPAPKKAGVAGPLKPPATAVPTTPPKRKPNKDDLGI